VILISKKKKERKSKNTHTPIYDTQKENEKKNVKTNSANPGVLETQLEEELRTELEHSGFRSIRQEAARIAEDALQQDSPVEREVFREDPIQLKSSEEHMEV
jgi:hypothetical protein